MKKSIKRIREPFDQYSRQYYIQKLINDVIKKKPSEKLKIIDLGGHKGNTAELLPSDEVTILDVFEEEYEGYVRGDATNTNFEDGAFDLSTSFDVFEHIPRPLRKQFIRESIRISRLGTFLAAPFDDKLKRVSRAEYEANRVYERINEKEHPWLTEHIEYGTPTCAEIEDIIKKDGLFYCRISSNPLENWLLMQSMIFVSTALDRDVKEVVDVNEFYNTNIDKLEDINALSYRSIYFISKNRAAVEGVEKRIAKVFEGMSKKQAVEDQLRSKIFFAISAMLKEMKDDKDYLLQKTSILENDISHLINKSSKLESELESIRQSFLWKASKPLRAARRLLR